MAHKPILRRKHQIGGVFVSLLAGGITVWGWYTPLGAFFNLLFPAFCIIGLGVILFPDPKEERVARGEDISDLSRMQLLTPQWWVILIVAVLAGIENYTLLSLRSGAELIEVIIPGVLFGILFVLYGFAKKLGIKYRQNNQRIRKII